MGFLPKPPLFSLPATTNLLLAECKHHHPAAVFLARELQFPEVLQATRKCFWDMNCSHVAFEGLKSPEVELLKAYNEWLYD